MDLSTAEGTILITQSRAPARLTNRTSGRGRRLRRGLAIFLALAAAPAAASLQAQAQRPDSLPHDSSVIAVGKLVVRVARPVSTTGGASALVAELDSLHASPVPTMDEALRAMPLVQVRTNSRGEATLALRGAEERQIAILVDGVPLTLGWDHRTDLSVLPMTAARSMTLVRGLSSVLHGPNVLGGVVEVDVARGPAALQRPDPLRLQASVDHLGGRTLGVTGGGIRKLGDGQLVLRAGGGYRERPGFARPAGAADPFASEEGLRVNSDLQHVDGFLAARYAGRDGQWVSLSTSAFNAERGVPPELHEASPRLWRYPAARRFLAALSGGTGTRNTGLGQGDIELSLGLDDAHTEIDSYTTLAYDDVEATEVSDDRTYTLRALGEHTLGPARLSVSYTHADVNHDEVITELPAGDAYPATYRQRLWSVGGEVALRFQASPEGAISGGRLSAGLALDGSDTPETGGAPAQDPIQEWGGRIGASVSVAGGGVLLHTGISRRGRFPALRELYSTALGKFEPNPTLTPEILTAGEAGFTTQLKGVELQTVVFHQRLTDAIVRTSAPPTSTAKYMRINRDEVRSTGVELLAGWRWPWLGVEGDMTLQDVQAVDPGDPTANGRAEYEPRLAGNVDLTAPLPARLRAIAAFEYMSTQYCVSPDAPDGWAEVAPNAGVDLSVDRTWGARSRGGIFSTVTTTLAVDNVTDATRYDQCGLPRPGRTVRLQVSVR